MPHRRNLPDATLGQVAICALTWAICVPALSAADELKFDELRFDATSLLDRSVTRDVRMAADGKAVELDRGVLIEDDGPAAGFSYQPNEEVLTPDMRLVKTLLIADPHATQASLLVGPGGDLSFGVNGVTRELKLLGKAGNYWQRYLLPVDWLRAGKNEIELGGSGKVWIARADDFPAGSRQQVIHPRRSRKSPDRGGTWHLLHLGVRDNVAGEYCVRIFLDQFRPTGSLLLPVVDLGNLNQADLGQSTSAPGPVTIKVGAECGEFGRLVVQVRTGSTCAPDAEHWTAWRPLDAAERIDKPGGRFLQVMLDLATGHGLNSPRVSEVTIAAPKSAAADWQQHVRVTSIENPAIVRTSIPFDYEPFDEPGLRTLRREQRLDDVVAGTNTEWELVCSLAAWASKQWESGHLGEQYPPWNANEILKLHADGKPVGGFCQQYNLVFLQACESFGLVGRAVSIGAGDNGVKIRSGHEVVEIWSNQFNKWVYIDGQAAWYFIDAKSQTPLSLLELRERQLAALGGGQFAEVKLVRLAKTRFEWSDFTAWPAFTELRLIPRSNFLEVRAPLPLNQGMRGWFWTGHCVWTDELSPASLLYGQRVARRSNWDWTLNGVRFMLIAAHTPGEIRVHLDTETPGLQAFRATLDRGESREVANEFAWQLHAGVNWLEVWPVNDAGRAGIVSRAVLEYHPQ